MLVLFARTRLTSPSGAVRVRHEDRVAKRAADTPLTPAPNTVRPGSPRQAMSTSQAWPISSTGHDRSAHAGRAGDPSLGLTQGFGKDRDLERAD